MANQLKFESIVNRLPIEFSSLPTILYKKHKNNWDGNGPRNMGRDGQVNDTPYPTCPYHMPINSTRFQDPRLYIPTKVAGDIIRAQDLNDLIDRMKILIKVWNAEQDDLKGYGIRSKIRTRITHLYPNHIVRSVDAGNGIESAETFSIYEGSLAVTTTSQSTVLTNNVTHPTVNGTIEFTTSFRYATKIVGNGNKLDFYSFEKLTYFDDPSAVYKGSLTFTDTNIQGEVFLTHELSDETDTFSSTYWNSYDTLILQPEGQRLDVYTRVAGFMDPVATGELLFDGASFSGPHIEQDCKRFKIVASGTTMRLYSVTAIGSVTTSTTVAGVTTTTTTPVVDNNKELLAPNRLETLIGTYTISGVTTTTASTINVTGASSVIEEPKDYGFYMIIGTDEAGVRANVASALTNPAGITNQIHKNFKIGDMLPYRIPENLINNYDNTAHNHHGGVTDLLPIQVVNGLSLGTYNLRVPSTNALVCNNAGVPIEFANNTAYIWSYRTPEPEGFIRYIGLASIEIPRMNWGSDATGTKNKIDEYDWTYRVTHDKNYKAKYPIIKQVEWNKLRNTLRTYCDKVINLDLATLDVDNTGVSDFLAAQVGNGSTTTDLNDPDTAFDNYQAETKALVKVNFYNVLVEAYRVLVNSCLCNSDCSCNSNCLCNTNCGCNYSG